MSLCLDKRYHGASNPDGIAGQGQQYAGIGLGAGYRAARRGTIKPQRPGMAPQKPPALAVPEPKATSGGCW